MNIFMENAKRLRVIKIIFISVLLINCLYLKADEPPSYCEASIFSKDSTFRADIRHENADTNEKPWKWDWILYVYQTKPETTYLWSSKLYYDGYSQGLLSDDGRLFAYVNYWYYPENSYQAIVYTQDSIYNYSSEYLQIEDSLCVETVSHLIWLEEYYFSPNYLTDSTLLILRTIYDKLIQVEIKTGNIQIMPYIPDKSLGKVFKAIGLGVILLIAIYLIILAFRK